MGLNDATPLVSWLRRTNARGFALRKLPNGCGDWEITLEYSDGSRATVYGSTVRDVVRIATYMIGGIDGQGK